ncbi:hypothetical protein AGOR_G00212740 [Albula goreensis]|uniref:B-cell receptor CD22 n=1 Tax=Albula goreensis TaxID=1534307 RepID=A0A8T3CPI1_9TELE|nr:hypothetical protein AGOR_G00212740 [Albula goreensis]
MGLRDTLYFWSLTLLTLPGVLGANWGVWYPDKPVCAVRGSTVIIPCSYCNNTKINPEFKSRAEYLGNTPNCTLKIKNIMSQDSGTYRFRFEAEKEHKWTGPEGVELKVTELRAEGTSSRGTETIMEGQPVGLTCTTQRCSIDQSQLTWLKNGQVLPGQVYYSHNFRLELNSVSYQDSGNYSCALKENPHISSNKILLDVQYPPRNMSVLVSPSGEPVEGSSVTLTCSSEANPPADSYTWFKTGAGALETGKGQSYTITNIRPEDSGLYYCRAENKHGALNSDAVTLTVAAKSSPLIIPVLVGVTLAVLVVALVVIVCIKREKGKAGGSGAQAQTAVDNVYASTTDLQNFQPEQQTNPVSSQEEVNYASVQFKKKKSKRSSLRSEQPEEAGIIYSTLRT